MSRVCNSRLGHYCLLLTVAGATVFPNLGRPSLWDIDEGNNAEAAREMLDSGQLSRYIEQDRALGSGV